MESPQGTAGTSRDFNPAHEDVQFRPMSHTYYSLMAHCVFATKLRRILIPSDLKKKLWPYMAGIARMNKFKALAVGGMEDHAHILLSLPTTITVAKAVQLRRIVCNREKVKDLSF